MSLLCLCLIPVLIAAAPRNSARKPVPKKAAAVKPEKPSVEIHAPAAKAPVHVGAPQAEGLNAYEVSDTLPWFGVDVEESPFRVNLPEGWMSAQRSNFENHRIVVQPSRTREDSMTARNVVGLAVKLFRDGAGFVAGELGATLGKGDPPIMVWMQKLDVPAGQIGTARVNTVNDMEELTMAPVWDTVVTVREHPVIWLESHRDGVKNDSLDLPPIRVISLLFEEPAGTYRWTSTFKEDRSGALELVNRLLQNLQTR